MSQNVCLEKEEAEYLGVVLDQHLAGLQDAKTLTIEDSVTHKTFDDLLWSMASLDEQIAMCESMKEKIT